MTELGTKYLRMVTGEDLISEVAYIEQDSLEPPHYILYSPMKILYKSGKEPGLLSLSLMQWIFHSVSPSQTFKIYLKDILFVAEADIELIGYYHTTVDYFEDLYRNTSLDDVEPILDPDEGLRLLSDVLNDHKKNDGTIH